MKLEQTGTIYCLTNDKSDLVYIGSTTYKLNLRFNVHKCYFRKWVQNPNNKYYSSFQVFLKDPHGTRIKPLLEDVPLNDLCKYEAQFIDNNLFNVCNLNRANQFSNDSKQYYLNNKDMFKKSYLRRKNLYKENKIVE